PYGAFALALLFRHRKPVFGSVADALQHSLHFLMFFFQALAIDVAGHFDRRSDNENGAGKRFWNLEKVPGFLKRPRALKSNMEHNDGAAAAAGQHYWAGLGYIARAARTVNC